MPTARSRTRDLLGAFLPLLLTLVLVPGSAAGQEAILGEERIEPGISVIFEGAVKDAVQPSDLHLAESQTDVHLEARINWATDEDVAVPQGTPRGGFVPGLHVNARIENESTDQVRHVTLVPHVNLIDNFHYARNVALPGSGEDSYRVTFYVHPPDEHELSFHRDWTEAYGDSLFSPHTFEYAGVTFSEIVGQSRR